MQIKARSKLVTKVLAATVAGTFLVGGGLATSAVAAGAGGGNFTCSVSGVPGWGTITSKYSHPDKRHYATAVGKGRQTVYANAGLTATAAVGRDFTGNKCHWGF